MFNSLPQKALAVLDWDWPQFEAYFKDLEARELSSSTVSTWLADWSRLWDLIDESHNRLYVATTLNTGDEEASQRYQAFLDDVYVPAKEAENGLIQQLLASGLEPEGFEIPLRNMRAKADLFRDENLSLLSEHKKLELVYNQIIGAQTIEWEGEEITLSQLVPKVQDADRDTRERVWREASHRVLADRQAINENWVKIMKLRKQIAANADKPDFRAYIWQEKLRFAYTPEDCETFHAAIEEVVVPAAERIYERRREQMGVATLRPWDVSVDVMRTTEFSVDPLGRPPLKPFDEVSELEEKGAAIFKRVDPRLGEYFETMRRENLLDLANYKGKAPGAFCIGYGAAKRPFVFMNAIGMADNVSTLLHEAGHAFHVFEVYQLPHYQLHETPMEFNEVASMAMELLGAPYLLRSEGGFYSEQEYARARAEHLEGMLIFWPYMAVVDAFQHWVHMNHDLATDPANCDAKWGELWDRFIRGVDWSGLKDDKVTGWHRKLHIHGYPFYYVEYGLAQLGALQVWRNALDNQAEAVANYRKALALGCTVTLPELFAAAGAKFAFDAATLRPIVDLVEKTTEELSAGLE